MSVSLNPSNSLGFKRPLTQVVKRSLTITNHNTQPIAFKVKTTAPKLYCVRPNSGKVEPGESLDVSVMLQALREEPPLNAKCKDKFLIQSTLITPEKETMTIHDIWATPEKTEEFKVHQQKLRVTYLPGDGQTLEEEDEGIAHPQPSHMSTGDTFDVARQHPTSNGHHDSIPGFHEVPSQDARTHTPPADFAVAREDSLDDIPPNSTTQQLPASPLPPVESALTPGPSSEFSLTAPAYEPIPLPAPATTVPEHSNPELLEKYTAALAEINRLRATIENMAASPPDEFRRRNRALSDDGASVAETDVGTLVEDSNIHHQEGVPLQVVIIIALGVFITTYLFF
ncbi:VAMP-associated protein [Tricholoma matsutake]|nr:VAMP-associated protein [Tricholoma matsutake 945]